MTTRTKLLIFLVFLCFHAIPLAASPQQDPVAEALNARIEELQFAGDLDIGSARIGAREILATVYGNRGFRPMWTDQARVQEFIDLVASAPDDGLDPGDYFVAELRTRIARPPDARSDLEQADLDILMTESLVRFGYHQLFGKVNPTDLDANINFTRRFLDDRDPAAAIPEIIASPEPLRAQLDAAIPRSVFYRTLQKNLAEYRDIAAAGGWPDVPEGAALHPGDEDPRIALLRQRLVVTGDLPAASDTGSTVFDEDLENAVIRFQERHGLATDGVVGKASYAALNVPVVTRIDQLRLSLERLRWVRSERGERFVGINIAGFRVYLVDDTGIVWTGRAMVGKPYRQTPVFRGTLSYMEINPTWTVPPTILKKDVLPAIKKDPDYLKIKNMSVIDQDGRKVDPATIDWQSVRGGIPYSIRQEPGPNNALGEIKFIFPNKHFVFLHDTPDKRLFDRPERTFSSGCIRVEHPFELAALIMNDPANWSQAKLEAIRDTHQTRRINTPPLPVLVLYLTASAEQDGRPRFLKDIYGRDDAVLRALDGPVMITPLATP